VSSRAAALTNAEEAQRRVVILRMLKSIMNNCKNRKWNKW
jgi:hypothetical protein